MEKIVEIIDAFSSIAHYYDEYMEKTGHTKAQKENRKAGLEGLNFRRWL